MEHNELERRFPEARAIPRRSFVCAPTPVERMSGVESELGFSSLWIKRDDLSGEHYGGNKIRKLEYILADALEKGFERVVTMGAVGSHHVLATSIYARELGLEPGAQHWAQPVTPHVRDNLRALSTTRPDLRLVDSVAEVPFRVFKGKLDAWLASEPSAYFVAGGGSSPLGVLGYVDAALEFAAQVERGEVPRPDYVFVAAGTTGTLAGLVLGFKMSGLAVRVVGVRVVEAVVTNRANVLRLARAATGLLRQAGVRAPDVGRRDFDLLGDYLGAGYGEPTRAGDDALAIARRGDDIGLDPTYTGKCFAAVIGERSRMNLEDRHIVYWNTLSSVDLSARIERADVVADLPQTYLSDLLSKLPEFADAEDFARGVRVHG